MTTTAGPIGTPLILLGCAVSVISYLEWKGNQRALRSGEPLARSRLPQILAIAIAAIGLPRGWYWSGEATASATIISGGAGAAPIDPMKPCSSGFEKNFWKWSMLSHSSTTRTKPSPTPNRW